MKHNNHNSFILTSITKILEEAISATAGIGDGIETYALYDYVMQSVFLKMTGAQEQKMKCICWELATNDYEFRREVYLHNSKLSTYEMSSYEDKNRVYSNLVLQIKKNENSFNVYEYFNKDNLRNNIRDNIYSKMEELLLLSNLSSWKKRLFLFYLTGTTKIHEKNFALENTLLYNKSEDNKKRDKDKDKIKLRDIYEQLYHHRNRCAHNTLSYQQNLPTLDTLRGEEYVYENYFIYFSILILIDEIMMKLYQKYLEVID